MKDKSNKKNSVEKLEIFHVDHKVESESGDQYTLKLTVYPSYSDPQKYDHIDIEFNERKERIESYSLDNIDPNRLVTNLDLKQDLQKPFLKGLIKTKVFRPSLFYYELFSGSKKVHLFRPELKFNPNFEKRVFLKEILPKNEVKALLDLFKELNEIIYCEGRVEDPLNIMIMDMLTNLEVSFLLPKDSIGKIGVLEIENNHVVGLDLARLSGEMEIWVDIDIAKYIRLGKEIIFDFFPQSISKFSNLKYLNLSYNQITEIPASIGNLTLLEKLDLSNNKITLLPDEITECHLLEELDLSYNYIRTLPEKIWFTLEKLTDINLARNNLTSIPAGIFNLIHRDDSYFRFDISQNRIINMDSFDKDLRDFLEDYWIEGEDTKIIVYDEHFFYEETQKTLSQLTEIEKEAILDINQLNSYMLFCKSKDDCGSIFIEDNKIKAIHLYADNFFEFESIPDSITQLENLEELALGKCGLINFPTSFNWKNLTKLSLTNNKIKILPEKIKELSNLKELDLTSNEMEKIDQEALKSLKKLKKLYLEVINISPTDIILLESLPETMTNLEDYKIYFKSALIVGKGKLEFTINKISELNGDYAIFSAEQNKFFAYLKKKGIHCKLDYEYSEYEYIRINGDQEINYKMIFNIIEEYSNLKDDESDQVQQIKFTSKEDRLLKYLKEE